MSGMVGVVLWSLVLAIGREGADRYILNLN